MATLRKAALLILLSTIFLPVILSAQETEDAELTTSIDLLFNQYIELENRILLEETALENEIYEIRKLKTEAEKANRRDLISRLEMLTFVVNTRLNNELRTSEAESILEKILTKEQRRLGKDESQNAGKVLTAATMGTALTSGMLFLGSSLLYDVFYSKYTATDDEDQAAFYLFWWETGKTTSIITGWTTAAAAAASGIFALLF